MAHLSRRCSLDLCTNRSWDLREKLRVQRNPFLRKPRVPLLCGAEQHPNQQPAKLLQP